MIVSATVLALATAVSAPPAGSLATQRDTGAVIVVQNNRDVRVTIFLEQPIGDLRVGTVLPRETATLPLPRWIAVERSSVRLFIHPEGGFDLESQPFDVYPGARLSLVVPVSGAGYRPREQPMVAQLSAAEAAETTLTIDNGRSEELVVYLEQGNFDLRLGKVAPRSTATLHVPERLAREHDSVQIFVHVVNGQDLESHALELRPGAHLGLRVPAPKQ